MSVRPARVGDAAEPSHSGDALGVRCFPGGGRFVAAAAPLALVALTAAWLFLGATPVRAALMWCSLVVLAACVVVLGAAVVGGGGRSRRETYRWAVRAASATPGRGEGTVPSRLGGTRRLSARYAGVLVAIPTLLALWATLAAADARGTGRSAVLAEAGAVIEMLPVVKIENQVAEGSSPRAAATGDYTVLLPSPTGGDGVPATFETSVNRRQAIGSELYVAYVPERPELGAVGDDQRQDVERRLAGRTVQWSDAFVIRGFWILVTSALVVGFWATGSVRRRARTVGPGWKALRVTVTGAGKHTDAPPPGSAEAADEKKRREHTRQLRGLMLDGASRVVPFHSQMAAAPAGEALSGAQGWLLWHPKQRRGRDVLAELVGDDGWQLPGAVPVQVAEQVVDARLTVPAHPDTERRVRTLDLGAGWLVTASVPVVMGWLVALGCLAALLLVPDDGAWRLWTAGAGVLAPAVGHLMRGTASMDGGDGDADRTG